MLDQKCSCICIIPESWTSLDNTVSDTLLRNTGWEMYMCLDSTQSEMWMYSDNAGSKM